MFLKLKKYRAEVEALGLLQTVSWKLSRRLNQSRPLASLTSKRLRHPVWYRPVSSDLHVFHQVMVGREYSCFGDLADVGLIIDLGANVGYTSAYFLSQFPHCFVVAVEPDKDNFALLSRNLAPYHDRHIAVNAAVWPETTDLRMELDSLGALNQWGRRIVAATGSGEAVRAVDVPALIAMSGRDRISILKIDIEGAEKELFSRNVEPWLSRTDNLCIELHGADCQEIFENAIRGRGFAMSSSGELTVAKRAGSKSL